MGLHALTASYLMLANPMNEANSYIILAPALAFWAVQWMCEPAWSRAGWAVAVMALAMGLLPNIVRPLFGNSFALIFHPAMTLVFLGMLIAYHRSPVPHLAEPPPQH
jgi:hypothetical protein